MLILHRSVGSLLTCPGQFCCNKKGHNLFGCIL
nr:MAG TPA: hypothetical protein [Caudoviricetes sp.]